MPEEPVVLSNRYRIEDRLGSGGMAMVYRAHDLMLERTVALKILRRDFSHSSEFRESFRQEAKAAANLSHPNIVTIHDFGIDSNQLFIVMEYVPGTDLKTLLKQRRLEIAEALDLSIQACSGIGYAHRAGLIHCDIKPQNMLVTPDMRLKVVDFGIARALASISPDEQSEVVWGSPQYFAPEQATGNAPSPASDVYSLGIVLYEMLAGRVPFTGNSPEELARQHREAHPPSPRFYNAQIPVPLEQIILKVLSKEPSMRYRTADQLGSVLVNFKQQTAHPAPTAPVSPPAQMPVHPIANNVSHQPATTRPKVPSPVKPPHPASPALASTPQQDVRPSQPTFDWFTWLLIILAIIAVGGLIPFWQWVYYIVNPPL